MARYPTAPEVARVRDLLMTGGWWTPERLARMTGVDAERIGPALTALQFQGLARPSKSFPTKWAGNLRKIRKD